MECFFCQYKVDPDYKDIDNLKKFISARKRILSRKITGVCAKHQRKLAKQIKYARYLALIPYTHYQKQ
ncbi:MAG: 30S ribosomal protein S18 [Patescibacteria group bacterium]|nr:MAG: 30S ribosomal protein S18 [Patescibacteria group bacterium]